MQLCQRKIQTEIDNHRYFIHITNRTMKTIILTMLLLFDRYFGKTSSFSLLKYVLVSDGNKLKQVRSESELNGDDTVLDFVSLALFIFLFIRYIISQLKKRINK